MILTIVNANKKFPRAASSGEANPQEDALLLRPFFAFFLTVTTQNLPPRCAWPHHFFHILVRRLRNARLATFSGDSPNDMHAFNARIKTRRVLGSLDPAKLWPASGPLPLSRPAFARFESWSCELTQSVGVQHLYSSKARPMIRRGGLVAGATREPSTSWW